MTSYHFSGLAGAGMNPLAQLMRAWGHVVQGSDRAFDQGKHSELRERLGEQGIGIAPQDGNAILGGIERFVMSAAVELDTPEVRIARDLGIEVVPRPQLLAEVVNAAQPGIAVAGTSGKSTVTGMIAWILRYAGREHTFLGGAPLAGEGIQGGFRAGPRQGPLVAEACESDGTLHGYRPGIGIVTNITRDHAELSELRHQFASFASQCGLLIVNAGCREASRLDAVRRLSYGCDHEADAALEIIAAGPLRAQGVIAFRAGGHVDLDLPHPGVHNLENATAAALAAHELGIPDTAISEALRRFPGVARRFEVIGTTDTGIRVIDDYAHNADKIRAVITAAQTGCDRLVAVFQPHGYGPARFLRPELKALIPELLRPDDRFAYAGIFYAGGTVAQDISSRDLAADINASHCPDHPAVLRWLAETALPGDTVLLMGARDPDLPKLAHATFGLL